MEQFESKDFWAGIVGSMFLIAGVFAQAFGIVNINQDNATLISGAVGTLIAALFTIKGVYSQHKKSEINAEAASDPVDEQN